MPSWNMGGFQDGVSHLMIECLFFHDVVMMVLIGISVLIGGTLMYFPIGEYVSMAPMEGQLLEWVWTLIPGAVLIFVSIPSIFLMYMYDELVNYEITIKCLGHQWFWSYEYVNSTSSESPITSIDSFMLSSYQLPNNGFRLLDTDTSLMLPIWTVIQLLISSVDVLHAWTVPSLGVKMDAIPGRVNSLLVNCSRPGVYFGQCSEICGAYHSFMPIKIEVIMVQDFIRWLHT